MLPTLRTLTKKIIILDTGLHCITDKKGHVSVYTEHQYKQLTWWEIIKIFYNF